MTIPDANTGEGLNQLACYCERLGCRASPVDKRAAFMLYGPDKDMQRMADRGSFSPTTKFEDAVKLLPGRDWEWKLEWEKGFDDEMYALASVGDPAFCMDGKAITPALAMCAAAFRVRALIASGILTEGGDVKQAPGESLSSPTAEGGDAQKAGQ